MSFDWSNFLKHSGYLYNNIQREELLEANYRTIISRAYYSVFNKCLNYLTNQRGMRITSDRHNKVIKEFKEYPDLKHQELGLALERLRNKRIGADYHEKLNFTKKEAQSNIIRAVSIDKKLNNIT